MDTQGPVLAQTRSVDRATYHTVAGVALVDFGRVLRYI
jgi:hypothetical protein